MKVSIQAVGKLKAGPEADLCDRYLDRARKAGRQLGLRGFQVAELPEARGARAADRMAAEAEALIATLDSRAFVCLAEGGELLGSDAFAGWLRSMADSGHASLDFVIGGPDGLDPKVAAAAERSLSFGRLTWPHQLVRIMLAEQLYRATTILLGHPYHRA